MLNDNIKNLRKAKGLSQDELAIKLNVVRQTISKWEKGLSVPDSEMLLTIAEELETTVNTLLGETIEPDINSELKIIANKLEVINEYMVKHNESRRKAWRAIFTITSILAVVVLIIALVGFIYFASVTSDLSAITSVIGGADGPTAIFVTGADFVPIPVIVTVIVAIISAIGLYKTRKK
jgi:putative transcriptional regulator